MDLNFGRRLPLYQLPVIFEKDMAHYDLDFVGGEETPRACVLSVTEPQVVWTSRHKLRGVLLSGLLSHF